MKSLLDITHQDGIGVFQWKEGNGQYYQSYLVEFYDPIAWKQFREEYRQELSKRGIWGHEI